MTEDIKSIEQKHLDDVLNKIQNSIKETAEKLDYTSEQLAEVENSWKDVRVKTSDYNAIVETASSIRAQQQQIEQRENSRDQAERSLETLGKQSQRPYFARIDFIDDKDKETIYIGLASYSTDPNHYYVYDWRAPISSVYYDGSLGNVSYQSPSGEKTVNVKLKRQFQIEDGVIVTVFDTEETIGDQMLLDALSNNSSTKMKSIVTTIQKEQNQIIRDTESDLLFVQGAAGSGKTAAVLQRIAFLLYRYRGNINSGQIVLFSPNQLFNDYINQVLPDLGEQNMVQMTFYQYVNYRLPKMKVQSLQTRFELENRPENKAINELKGSLETVKGINQYVQELQSSGVVFKPIKFQDHELIPAEQISEIFYSFHAGYKPGQRFDATIERVRSILNGKFSHELNARWVEDVMQTMTQTEVEGIVGRIPDNFKGDETEYTRKKLANYIVKREFAPLMRKVNKGAFINPNAIFSNFIKRIDYFVDINKFAVDGSSISKSIESTLKDLKNRDLSVNDSTIYLYIYDLLTGHRGQHEMRHVFIDEVQDYTPLQLAFMKFSFPKAKFTLLGDLNQAIFTGDASAELESELEKLFNAKNTKTVHLNQTYRSTQQISDFARDILDNGQNIEAFERGGMLPDLYTVSDQEQENQKILDEIKRLDSLEQTIALIPKTGEQAEYYKKVLDDNQIQSTLILLENQRLAGGLVIVPSYLAKGLEFDAVILPDVDDQHFDKDSEKQLLYTLATRAMHNLSMIAINEPAQLIKKIPNELYNNHSEL